MTCRARKPIFQQRRVLAAMLTWVFTLGSEPRLWAANAAVYTGDIDLPIDMITEQGDLLRKGKFQLEVRVEQGHSSLEFRRKQETVASVGGESRAIEAGPVATKPLTGTLYMRLLESEGDVDSYGRGRRDDWFKFNRPWKAAMRVYESTGPPRRRVYFVFQCQLAPQRWSRIEFELKSVVSE